MKKQKIVNFKELSKISDKLGDALNTLHMLEPFIVFKDRYQYKRTYKFIEELYFEVENLIINMTDSMELYNK